MKPIPVLHLITELSSGGAQSALYRLLAHSSREKFTPRVACLFNGQGAVARQLRMIGIEVIDLGFHRKLAPGAFWRLYRLLKTSTPVILQTWMFHADLAGRLAGSLARVPLIIGSRRSIHIGGSQREILNRWTAPLVDKVIAVSDAAREAEIQHSGVSPEKVVTIYNGIDLEEFQPPEGVPSRAIPVLDSGGKNFLIGSAGRLHPLKGLSLLIEAFQIVSRISEDARLVIAGEGELHSRLKSQAAAAGLAGRVNFTGHWAPISTFLQQLDLFVSASLWEGLPNVVLEAMAAGLPVVATGVGGTPELVVDGETGLLVPAQDVEALAEAMITLLNDPERRRKMGTAGNARVRQYFPIQETVRKTEALYEALLETVDYKV